MPVSPIEISPFCTHLCSKKAYFLERPPREPADLLDASRQVWCRLTMEAVGPDDRLANTEGCLRGRRCFEPYGADPAGPAPHRTSRPEA